MKKNNIQEKLHISFEELEKRKTDNNSFFDCLKDFNVESYETIPKIQMTKFQKVLDFLYRANLKIFREFKRKLNKPMTKKQYEILDKIWHKILNRNGLYYYMPTNLEFYPSKNKNIIFYGTYENKDFFDEVKQDILQQFIPKKGKKQENLTTYDIIQRSNSICVTIRRGDFLIDKFKKDFFLCDSTYFEKALKLMNEKIENPQYVVFSDDIEWCKNNMSFPKETVYESGKDEIWEKIRLMYSCKHFIISNSTFSWWAQFLSRNEEKIVIAPARWNNFEYSDPIYEKTWIIIDKN